MARMRLSSDFFLKIFITTFALRAKGAHLETLYAVYNANNIHENIILFCLAASSAGRARQIKKV